MTDQTEDDEESIAPPVKSVLINKALKDSDPPVERVEPKEETKVDNQSFN